MVARTAAPVVLAVLAATLSACGEAGDVGTVSAQGAPTTGPGGPGYMVHTASVKGLGTVLVDGYGLTLYLFEPDHGRSRSKCSGYCASQWPPLTLPTGVTVPAIGKGANAAVVGTTRRGDGTVQVTYAGWPLYRWIGDTEAGQATGEGRDDSGGQWYAVDGFGQAVR